ncbi:Small G protein signaling modulator 2 [Halotydeus destructor]|nr:Small G protein signaling modulator 2 [Halotydeus destructor]
MADSKDSEKEYREKLLRHVKKEVKQIMEEAVTRKFVHEDSSSVSSLCSAVDSCLSHGLKRRALGLFKTNSTTALLQKVAKNYEPAATLFRTVQEIENADPNKRSSSSSDSTNKLRQSTKQASIQNSSIRVTRFLWIRIALLDKQLVGILDHLVGNAAKYYEKEALVADAVSGQILASLLVGPCALDYSKMKTQDHYWTDPPADELVQRHRLSSPMTNGQSTPPSGRKPLGLSYRKGEIFGRSSNSSDDGGSPRSVNPWSPRDYVESLHQNCKSTLLYGKNNVVVQPKENLEPMPGYLSLHQTPQGLAIKWTPNQLMNGNSMAEGPPEQNGADRSVYWDYALSVNFDEIVYLHCHQQESGGTIVLVGQDGAQMSPIRFPRGGHLLAFLSCLETGLAPYGQLDPPLWSQKGKGKVFPKLRRKGRGSVKDKENANQDEANKMADEDEASDYVFRIIASVEKPDSISAEMFDPKSKSSTANVWSSFWKIPLSGKSGSSSTASSTTSKSTFDEDIVPMVMSAIPEPETDSTIKNLCDSMRRQIISRAFYGWLAHCRHLGTVRTHLAALVNVNIVLKDDPCDASVGLTRDKWTEIQDENGAISSDYAAEVYRLIYFGGIEHCIRVEVWPYLMAHHKFGQTKQERESRDQHVQQHYETTMTEWLAVEAIVRQRDKEIMAANLAKLSSESTTSSDIPLTGPKDTGVSMSNDVFTDSEASDSEMDTDDDEANQSKVDSPRTPRKLDKGKVTKMRRQRKVESQGSQTILVTRATFDSGSGSSVTAEPEKESKANGDVNQLTTDDRSPCVSPVSSNGGVYSIELLDLFSLNVHRIDKDVQRCDRNFWYFADKDNLEKLRNVMCTYVWENLDQGYVQGMCDIVAPLLVIFDDEVVAYSCFNELMKRMMANFPNGGAMDTHFANMRSLIQILDNEIFELMHANGDYTHFYFCYRWFLLDFKRELVYDDIFRVWEAIWSAKHVASSNFVLFIALALVEYYRDIILENNMDFTDIIKFFNEMAERHDSKAVLQIARDLVLQIQTLIENK